MKTLSISILVAMMAVSCSVSGPAGAPTQGISAAPSVFVPIPTLNMQPTIEPTLASTSTSDAALFVPFEVVPSADNVFLRNNPGSLFAKLAVLGKGASLLLLGRSPGGEWLLVKTADNRVGWVFAQLIDYRGNDPTRMPMMMPSSAQQITGTVKDEQGQPISGIQFSFIQGVGNEASRTDAMTDSAGTFYAFMPSDARGEWSVAYTAVACTSNTMDSNCNCRNGACGKPYPETTSVLLPVTEGQVLSFVWK